MWELFNIVIKTGKKINSWQPDKDIRINFSFLGCPMQSKSILIKQPIFCNSIKLKKNFCVCLGLFTYYCFITCWSPQKFLATAENSSLYLLIRTLLLQVGAGMKGKRPHACSKYSQEITFSKVGRYTCSYWLWNACVPLNCDTAKLFYIVLFDLKTNKQKKRFKSLKSEQGSVLTSWPGLKFRKDPQKM